MTDLSGLIPIEYSVAKINVGLSVTSITPSTGLYQLGGDILIIAGTGLDLITENTSVVFSDGTTCDLISTMPTWLECTVSGFDESTLDTSSPYTVTVTVNSVTDQS